MTIENQMTWSYFAGYFDGEGCLLFGITKDIRKEKTKGSLVNGWNIIPSLSISSYDYEVLERLGLFLEANEINIAKLTLKSIRPNQTKRALRLSIMGWENISACIQKMLPYSIAKKEQLKQFDSIIKIKKNISPTKRNKFYWTKDNFIKAMGVIDNINSMKGGIRGYKNTDYFKSIWNL